MAALALSRRWSSSGTLRICTMLDMRHACFHQAFMSSRRPRQPGVQRRTETLRPALSPSGDLAQGCPCGLCFRNRGVSRRSTAGKNATVAALLTSMVSATSPPKMTWTFHSDKVKHR